MSVSNENVKETYNGNGSTIYWPITFEYADPEHIAVYLTDDDGVTGDKLESDYTVDEENERVIYPDPLNEELILPEGWKITLKRETPLIQNYQPSTQSFNPADIEPALDKTMMAIAEIKEENGRTIKANITEDDVNYTLPSPAQGLVVGWDLTDGTRLVNYTNPGAAAAEAEAFAVAAGEAAEAAGEAAEAAAGSASVAVEAEETIRGIVYHGWVSGLTAVYVSSNEIKIEGLDVTDRIQRGTKIRYKQGGDWKYDFVSEITANTDTTLTLMGGSTVTNEPITDFWFSNIANPIGWPFGVDYIEEANANGTWRKWADGTLECWGTKTFTSVVISNLWGGSIYTSPQESVTWPISFTVIESANINVLAQTPTQFAPVLIDYATSHQGNFYFWRPASFTYDSITVGFYAKGRWK